MSHVEINQLTRNPEFIGSDPSDGGPDFEYETTVVNACSIINQLLVGQEEDLPLVSNITLTEVDDGECVLSFKWHGEYEGVCVFTVWVSAS